MRKEHKKRGKMGKEAIRYGKSAYDINEFIFFGISLRIWQCVISFK